MREVTEEAALVVVMMLAERRLLVAGRAAGHDRTLCRRGKSIGLHRKPARCENLHQESQQQYWNDRFKPAPQRSSRTPDRIRFARMPEQARGRGVQIRL